MPRYELLNYYHNCNVYVLKAILFISPQCKHSKLKYRTLTATTELTYAERRAVHCRH